MRRFVYSADQRQGDVITLGAEESRHISRVLRCQPGQRVELADGAGVICLAQIIAVDRLVRLRVVDERQEIAVPAGSLLVGQGIIKPKKMELILQKCTELGVSGFYPFFSERAQGNLAEQYRGKGERWRRIITEACKQSLRPQAMEFSDLHPFDELVGMPAAEDAVRILFWERERETTLAAFREQLTMNRSVMLLFGPEGGFSDSEVELARERGWHVVSLGRQILRAETAAIAAVAIVQHHLGHM